MHYPQKGLGAASETCGGVRSLGARLQVKDEAHEKGNWQLGGGVITEGTTPPHLGQTVLPMGWFGARMHMWGEPPGTLHQAAGGPIGGERGRSGAAAENGNNTDQRED